jgi:hypothetical protein
MGAESMKTFCWLLTTIALSGCVTQSLRHQTSSQVATIMEMRYNEVIENLALIYANPEALPAYTSIFVGTTDVGDTVQATAATTWTRSQVGSGPFVTLFSKQTLDIPFTRSVKDNWTLDPTVLPEKLTAIKLACRWAVYGLESVKDDPDFHCLGKYRAPMSLLPNPSEMRPECYFDVLDQLTSLENNYHRCWLHFCDGLQRPRCAHYWASCHGKCVWVEPDGMEAFSQFTLVIQKIARATYDSALQPPVQTRAVKWTSAPLKCVDSTDKTCETQIHGVTVTANWYVDAWGTPTPGDGKSALPRKERVDNTGVNADVKSALSANTKSP